MTRFDETALIFKALQVLKEAAEECDRTQGPIRGSFGLRFALAYLSNRHGRGTADMFWQSATQRKDREILAETFGRYQTLNSCRRRLALLNGFDPRVLD